MRRWSLVLAAAIAISGFLTGVANAELLEPPAKWVRPHPGMMVKYLSMADVDKVCRIMSSRAMGKDEHYVGCALSNKSKTLCFVVLPNDAPQLLPHIARHENAHCNGWPGDHPGGKPVVLD